MSDQRHPNFHKGDRVLHPDHGTGEVIKVDDTSSAVHVDFDRTKHNIVDASNLELQRELLHNADVHTKREWADEPAEGEDPLLCGEAIIFLDFTDDVNYDVDVQPNGRIVVQYWDES